MFPRLMTGLSAIILGLCLIAPAWAQELPSATYSSLERQRITDDPGITYPRLPHTGRAAEAFVPQGWALETQKQGDLNGDGRADLAMVLQQQDPANIVPMNDNRGVSRSVNTNPRILAVAFAQADGSYVLVMENHTLISRQENPVQGDPFDSSPTGSLSIDRGTLRIKLFASTSNYAFTFRWQNNAFHLIGNDSEVVYSANGMVEKISMNYLTHEQQTTFHRLNSEQQTSHRNTFPAGPLLTIDQIGRGLGFGVELRR